MKTEDKFGSLLKVLFISAILIFAALISTSAVAAEEIRTGDSIAPMKMKIDMDDETNPDNETITKIIFVKNTGNTPIHYIFYTEQTGGKNEISSEFKLSETETEISPGNTFELSLTVSKKELEKYDLKDLENVKIKMIRNPESQMPVGYIIPVEINNYNEKMDEKTTGSKKSIGSAGGITGISEKILTALNDTKGEGSSTQDEKNENPGKNDKTNGEGNQNPNKTTKIIIAIGILITFTVLIGGVYLTRKRK